MPQYYPINEDAARHANLVNSYYTYKKGSTTEEYRKAVDEAAALAERQKRAVDPMYHEKIDRLLDSYARKLADWYNNRNAIEARVPSMLVAGGSNFPDRKKEKQNAARSRSDEEYNQITGILKRIKGTGKGGIMSDEDNAIDKLRAKMAALEREQEKMKAVNAYYRKNGTLDGCELLTFEEIETRKAAMGRSFRKNPKPYESFLLTNNNAKIRHCKDRIAELEREAQRAESGEAQDLHGDGYELRENSEAGRIQFIFDGKPDEEIRAILKANGFRWAPSEKAWQRMLNDNGRRAAQAVIKAMQQQEEPAMGQTFG